MSQIYIGQRLMCVPSWQFPERGDAPPQVRVKPIYKPMPAKVVYINAAHRYYTVRYERTGLMESFKEG